MHICVFVGFSQELVLEIDEAWSIVDVNNLFLKTGK
jgi:hypothetical protein